MCLLFVFRRRQEITQLLNSIMFMTNHLTPGGYYGSCTDRCLKLHGCNSFITELSVLCFMSLSSLCKSVQRSQSVCSKKVESKYLGTLKVLDLKVPQDSQPQAADSLRAAIYQVSVIMMLHSLFKMFKVNPLLHLPTL